MTFILNILHKDMSLLAADRKATAEGPTTITMPGITVHAQGGAEIHGYKKLAVNQSRRFAIGFAGNTQDHGYVQAIEQSASIDEGMRVIRSHMESHLRVHERTELVSMTSFTENQGIASFYDEHNGTYFSNIFLFSPVHCYTRLFARTIDGARLLHVGTGSENFEKAVGVNEINTFIGSLQESCTTDECIQWVREAYRKVSAVDSGTGEEVVFLVSTRSQPDFQRLDVG